VFRTIVETSWLIIIGVAGSALAGTTAYFLFRRGPDAAELERRRLHSLLATGRITAGEIDDVRGGVLYYSYEVAGVGYGAAQDLNAFPVVAHPAFPALSGSVSVRFDRANPGNSMVHCESWSGLPLAASNMDSQPRPECAHQDVPGSASLH
jgi:hypothetical protein